MSLSKTVTVTFSWEQLTRELEAGAGKDPAGDDPYLISSLQKQCVHELGTAAAEIVSTVPASPTRPSPGPGGCLGVRAARKVAMMP